MATISIVEYTPFSDHREFTVLFFGTPVKVTVTKTSSVVRSWLHTVFYRYRRFYHRSRLVVGLGVQWTPFSGPNSPADTLQLCVGQRCLIFHLCNADTVPRKLRRFLLDPQITFVGFWNSMDARKLRDSWHDLQVHSLLDLRKHVKTDFGESLAGASVEKIVKEFLGFDGVRLDREISMSYWNAYELTHKQVLQACVDAHVAFLIGKNIRAWEIDEDDTGTDVFLVDTYSDVFLGF
ncbi:hypothetical protein HS088_TW13G01678 [Tripterygium wilfordii]|uniref:3'-5' exonuclease domain-containing protein n=1 Tax=Tripterygium wilfordii TaxID=458696 RepID=A0A7J7CXE6_TRIWF|nr:uncharacterized protein LOC120013553 [Tripterygium wilfordii]KAF5738777.1 hypothetical protein HS088_TW13G01678 [Tripterygium wilfordii]